MEEKELISFLKQAKSVIQDFFPEDSIALVPVIFSSLIWSLNRRQAIKSQILEMRIWLEPGTLKNKPAEFILDFFESIPDLKSAYAEELAGHDLRALRAAFRALYPILGLENPFLEKLFSEELNKRDYRRIVSEFKARLTQALAEIEAVPGKRNFWKTVKEISERFLSLGWSLMTESQVREELKKIFEKLGTEP
jgi:hypothetical protein